jgi:Domain of unknown function (DUF1839)
MNRLLPIDAASYIPSPLHGDDRVWVETNCYIDLWIELLNALDLDCRPALCCTLSVDFEGDQWQFFKFSLDDLRALYGLEVAEMNPWRGLELHIGEQITMGRLLTAEVDSWYLPDTAGVSYHIEHVKTSIVPNMIDTEHRRLGYFHGAGYYELEGDDFGGLFGHHRDLSTVLLPYVELVKLDGLKHLDQSELLKTALELVQAHLARRPATNPLARFRERLRSDIEWLREAGLTTFHQYAFATLRQFGSAAELTGSLCAWLAASGEPSSDPGREWAELAESAKAAQFQLARVVSGREIDVDSVLETMEQQWDRAMGRLVDRYA